jgi:hypothetical protein
MAIGTGGVAVMNGSREDGTRQGPEEPGMKVTGGKRPADGNGTGGDGDKSHLLYLF